MTYTITVPGRMPSLNKFTNGRSWQSKASEKTYWKGVILWQFNAHGLPKALRCPISVKATQHTKRVRDLDNVVISAKYCGDALVEGGYIPDDTPTYVSEVVLRWAKAIGEEKVVYEITELTPNK